MKIFIGVMVGIVAIAFVLGVVGYVMLAHMFGAMRSAMHEGLSLHGPTVYRLTNCTSQGLTLLKTASHGQGVAYGTVTFDGGLSEFFVGRTDWPEAERILNKLRLTHPKDFSKEADAPDEAMPNSPFDNSKF